MKTTQVLDPSLSAWDTDKEAKDTEKVTNWVL